MIAKILTSMLKKNSGIKNILSIMSIFPFVIFLLSCLNQTFKTFLRPLGKPQKKSSSTNGQAIKVLPPPLRAEWPSELFFLLFFSLKIAENRF